MPDALGLKRRELPRFVWPFLLSYFSTAEGGLKVVSYCINNVSRLLSKDGPNQTNISVPEPVSDESEHSAEEE